jgi:hypothetical protein
VQTIGEAWLPGGGPVNWWGMQCWSMKISHYAHFWGDYFVGHARLIQLLVVLMFVLLLCSALYAALVSGPAKKPDLEEKGVSHSALSAGSQ